MPQHSDHPHPELLPRQHPAAGFVEHRYERTWTIDRPREAVWAWLNDPRTFTRQVWPYRVEFVEGSGADGGGGFGLGVLNVHHGPLLHAAGVLTDIDAGPDGRGRSRDLHYCYGAYVIGMRLIRPTLLRFTLADAPGPGVGTVVTVLFESQVRRGLAGLWGSVLGGFWATFGPSMRAGAGRKLARPGG